MEKKKIAIIEDDKNFLGLLETMLKNKGYEVYGAATGIDITGQMIDDKPDLIILDLMLPLISGEKVIDVFQKKEVIKDVPVIIISGKEEKEIKDTAKEMGAVAYIKKPITDTKNFLNLVKKYIGRGKNE